MTKQELAKYILVGLVTAVLIFIIYSVYRSAPQASETTNVNKPDNCSDNNTVFIEGNIFCIRVIDKDDKKPVKKATVTITIPDIAQPVGSPNYSGVGAPLVSTTQTNNSGYALIQFSKITDPVIKPAPTAPAHIDDKIISRTHDFIVNVSKTGYKKVKPVTLKAFVAEKVVNTTVKLELKNKAVKPL